MTKEDKIEKEVEILKKAVLQLTKGLEELTLCLSKKAEDEQKSFKELAAALDAVDSNS